MKYKALRLTSISLSFLLLFLYNPIKALADDHGDTPEEASVIIQGTSMLGEIEPGDDLDYFQFSVTDYGYYYMYTGGNLDTYGKLYNENLNLIESDDDDGHGDNFKIGRWFQPGTYYILVYTSWVSEIGSYELYLDGPSAHNNPLDDHGDTIYASTSLFQGSTVTGQINPDDDLDYFQFSVTDYGYYYIYTGGNLDTYGKLYDENLSQIESDDDDGHSDNFRIVRWLQPGTYYIMLYTYWSDTGSYALYLDGPSAHNNPFDDHGDTIYAATVLYQGTPPMPGQINPGDDLDYFKFTVADQAWYYIYTGGNLDTYGKLYDENLNQIESDSSDGHGDNFKILRWLQPGSYYVLVTSYWSNVGSYTLYLDGPSAHNDPFDDHADTHYAATLTYSTNQVAGYINLTDDLDFFEFFVQETDEYTIQTTGTLDTYGQLLDESLNQIASDYDDGDDDNFLMTISLEAGTYYVVVKSESSTGGYSLEIDGPAPIMKNLNVYFSGNGTGRIVSEPDGIDCPGDCNGQFLAGAEINITVFPESDSAFTGWSGSLSGRYNPAQITMDANKSLTGYFLPVIYVEPNGICGGNDPCYASLYNAVAGAWDSIVIKVSGNYSEYILFDILHPLEIWGGWNSDFTGQTSVTRVESIEIIESGIAVENLVIGPVE